MKKLLVALVALFCVNAVSAQVNNAGIRFSGGIDIVGQYDLSKSNYIDGRLTLSGGLGVTGIYTWRLMDFNWTPQYGKWFLDAGIGGGFTNVGRDYGGSYSYLDVVGSIKLGFKFKKAPVSIIWDASPSFGLWNNVDRDLEGGYSSPRGWGGVSVVYHF